MHSRWYKKFFSQKIFSFPPLFLLLPSPFPPKSPIFPISLPSWPCIPKFSRGYAPNTTSLPPSLSAFDLRQASTQIGPLVICRLGEKGKGEEGKEKGGRILLFTAPSQPKPASGPSKSGAQLTTYITSTL